ncbi:MAG: ABC transporter permease [Candidatus Omnitrophica bacterium]|nr:ABC transporter permease [Candidatus Omnitrophota bacterium]
MKKRCASGMFLGSIMLLSILFGAALFAPQLTGADPREIRLEEALLGPSWQHPFGTDQLGRDVYARMLYGARVSIAVGFVAVGIATLLGVLIGSVSGYLGGWIDTVLMRFTDIMLCFPTLFLILAAIAFLGPSIFNIMAIIGLTGWMGVARLVRAEILTLKEREFVQAARVIGCSHPRIILRHLLPNAMAPVIVSATLGIGSAVLIESALSFLGIGVQPPDPSWGNILAEGKSTLGVAPWLIVIPGIAICWIVLGFNMLGEALRQRWRS